MAERVNVGLSPSTIDRFATRLIYRYVRTSHEWTRVVLRIVFRVDMQPGSSIGPDLQLAHVGAGHLLGSVDIGRDVLLCPLTAIGGKSNVRDTRPGGRVVLGDHVVVGIGAAIIVAPGETLVLGKGTVLGANAVLTRSTGEWETWAGNPAVRLR